MVSQSEVIIQTPNEFFTPPEQHAGTYFALQFGKHVIAFRFFGVPTQGTGTIGKFVP
jgi:hypothetical protein